MGLETHNKSFTVPAGDSKKNLLGLTLEEIQVELEKSGLEKFRAKQVWGWLYSHGVRDFSAMNNIAKPTREILAEKFTIARPEVVRKQESEDGTRKWLFRMPDGQEIETVHIPEEDRGALCVSSQVGCTLTCRFCHTGTQRLVRNLEAREIVSQILLARDELNEWPSTKEERMLSNIVMMGMGEPLYNYDNVAKALKIVMDPAGIAISKRKITLSTSGVAPMIKRCGEELNVNLAISLHATNNDLRDKLIPLNKKYPLEELMQACRDYPGLSNARRITFEYIMLKDVNDSDADARALVKLIRNIPAKVNLIPFNPWPGAPFECSSRKRIEAFGDIINAAGYASPVRTPRGRDILAACGQLRSESLRLSAAERAAMDETIAQKEQAAGLK